MYSRATVTRIGSYCFDLRVLAWFFTAATAVMLFAPSVIQAAFLLLVGSCPVTAVAGLCKAAKLHPCLEGGGDWERSERREEEPEPVNANPYAGLASSLFGRHK